MNPRRVFIEINTETERLYKDFGVKGFRPINVGVTPGDCTSDPMDEAVLKVINNVLDLIRALNVSLYGQPRTPGKVTGTVNQTLPWPVLDET
jgi:hypothetical protein